MPSINGLSPNTAYFQNSVTEDEVKPSSPSHKTDDSQSESKPVTVARPDLPKSYPRASLFQEKRFASISEAPKGKSELSSNSLSKTGEETLSAEQQPRAFTGSWKKANADIVSHIASHLAAPDRVALSQSSSALRESMAAHNVLKVPEGVSQAWAEMKRGGPEIRKALDRLLEHLPSASNLDKTTIATAFIEHIDNIKSNPDSPKNLLQLYNSLSSISAKHPEVAASLIEKLLDYGINRLPSEAYAIGLEKISTSLHDMALTRNELSKITDLQDTAISKFAIMAQHNILNSNEVTEIHKTLSETTNLIQAGKLHDYYQTIKENCQNVLAESTLNTLSDLNNVQAKLGLASYLITHFDKIKSEDKPNTASQLEAVLQPLHDKGVQPDITSSLLYQIKALTSSPASNQ